MSPTKRHARCAFHTLSKFGLCYDDKVSIMPSALRTVASRSLQWLSLRLLTL
ncbi:unnamed protein product [Acanthoscelides obtectus]|uniref:Uncharacterized protein n=1 Tax=Acanthoscelides obtectus TaxID=200917 RepID=A0A9P0MDZ3_ACAOB|nr:unnamed protein product [Acanthoscelides obtectus]CAK1640872.1 hypothetical protein AOBTE_LOCUS11986 [Acanthoscelides obtectus]